jgi:imidazolonepropionase-like amidohydrolase
MEKAIINGTVCTPSEKIDSGVVLISGNKIHFVGRASEAQIPTNAEIFDVGGRLVYQRS